MLSTKKLEETVNTAVVDALMEQIALYLETRLKEEWSKIVFELAATRKSNYKLIEAFNNVIKSHRRVEAYIATLQPQTKKTSELQAKEERILDFLIREFGIKPEG